MALFAPSRLRDREASFLYEGASLTIHFGPGQDAVAPSEEVRCDEALRLVANTVASSPTMYPTREVVINLPE